MSRKVMDCCNRWRSRTVSFRMSPEEDALLDSMGRLSGMTKQDYIMSKLTDTSIVVRPNSRTYKALKDAMGKVYVELSRIRRAGDMDESLVQRVKLLTDIFCELGDELPESPLDTEANIIQKMGRS